MKLVIAGLLALCCSAQQHPTPWDKHVVWDWYANFCVTGYSCRGQLLALEPPPGSILPQWVYLEDPGVRTPTAVRQWNRYVRCERRPHRVYPQSCNHWGRCDSCEALLR